MEKTEKRINLYSSLLITIMLSAPKLLALRENGIIARYWHFNLAEWSFQMVYNFIFCYLFLYLNLNPTSIFSIYRDQKRWTPYISYNLLLGFVFTFTGILIEWASFPDPYANRLYFGGYLIRFGISGLLIAILIKIVTLIRETQRKDKENQALRSAFMTTELELLKEQLNPHFLFNSLSSLSGVIKEDPALAQHYIKHLSKVFRYALARSKDNMVTISEELTILTSYAELLTMRFEKAFKLEVDIDERYLNNKIPHLSLQPLLENAAKHNSATMAKPLTVKIFISDGALIVSNNLQPVTMPENSTHLGLMNLNERFRILMHSQIEITKTLQCFTVKLPLEL